jgi:hypothetical protein
MNLKIMTCEEEASGGKFLKKRKILFTYSLIKNEQTCT